MLTIQEKLDILNGYLNNINFHIEGFLTEKDTESFQNELYADYMSKKQAIENEIVLLTNQ